MNEGIVDLAWLFCKRAKEKGLDEEDIKWVLERVLERFDNFECLGPAEHGEHKNGRCG